MNDILNKLKVFDDLRFEENGHKYFWKDKEVSISTTGLINLYANEFDSSRFSQDKINEWKIENEHSQLKGNLIHLYAQSLWVGTDTQEIAKRVLESNCDRLQSEFKILRQQADKLYYDMKDNYELIGVEVLIYDEEFDIASAIDILLLNKLTGGIAMIDLKSNKEIKDYSYINSKGNKINNKMKIPLRELIDCSYIHYSMQLAIMENTFEKYVCPIEEKFIVWFDVNNFKEYCDDPNGEIISIETDYTIIETKNVKNEVIKILENRRVKNMNSVPILIYGKSGTGKSTSLRNFKNDEIAIINVLGKPLPFKNELKNIVTTDDYTKVLENIKATSRKVIVIDDAGYLIVNQFMRNHSKGGGGNAVFAVYNELADNFWKLINDIKMIPGGKRIYINMHEETDDNGITKPKTIGKLLDDKVCIEGMFTVAIRTLFEDGKYKFRLKNNGNDVTKTPFDMFEIEEMENDLKEFDKIVNEYYELDKIEDKKEEEK